MFSNFNFNCCNLLNWRPISLGWQAILLSKMASGIVGVWLSWWCHALVLPAPVFFSNFTLWNFTFQVWPKILLELEGQGRGIIMEVTCPLLLGPFYLVKWSVNPNIWLPAYSKLSHRLMISNNKHTERNRYIAGVKENFLKVYKGSLK